MRGQLRVVHGWGTHGGVFAGLDAHRPPGWRWQSIDLPGHGERVAGETFEFDVAVEDLAGSGGPPAVWMGWSLGGSVAMAAAARYPERVAALVLVAATPRFLAAPDWPQGMDPAVFAGFQDELQVDLRRTLDRFIALEVHGSRTARADRATLRDVLATRPLPNRASLQAGLDVLARLDLRDELAAIRCPVLVVAGANDRIVRPGAARALSDSVPDGQFVLCEGCGHAPFIGRPREFSAHLSSFLEGLDHESAA